MSILNAFDAESEEDNYRPSKRARADFRPPAAPRSNDDADGMQSSPGRSQRDVPTTDHTDEEPYEVFFYSIYSIILLLFCYSFVSNLILF